MKSACGWLLVGLVSTLDAAPHQPTNLMGKLPLRFEENWAGTDTQARYIARGPNFLVSLAPAETWLRWKNERIRTRLIGASRDTRIEPEQKLPGSANYFLGNATEWRHDVRGYARVRYHEIYPGIDLIFHGEQGRLEYDFVVAPNVDPQCIQLELDGQRDLKIDAGGDLVVSTKVGDIRWKRPDLFQEIDGKRIPVTGRFVRIGKRSVGFAIGDYDARRELVIDPALSYSTFLGGNGNEFARGIGIDGAGNVYIAGGTTSPNLPVVSAVQTSYQGRSSDFLAGDAFVAKFSPSGQLVYLTYVGGTSDDVALSLAVDSAGNAYITGYTASRDFPTTTGAYQTRFGGSGGRSFTVFGDAFVAKLNPAGNRLLYSTYLGGNLDDIGTAIAIDSTGSAYVTGSTLSLNFPTTSGAYQTSLKGGDQEPVEPCCGGPWINGGDAFVVKLDPAGATLAFSTLVGGSSDDVPWTLALDSSNNVYIGGFTLSANFPVTSSAYQRTYGGAEMQTPYFVTGDGFIAKLNSTGTALVFSTYFGGGGDEFITGIAVDSSGAVYFTGYSSTGTLPVTRGALQPRYAGYNTLPVLIEYLCGDAIVGKLDPSGSNLVYLTYLGGSQNDAGSAIAVDSAGNAYVTGFTDSPDFPTTQDALQRTFGGDGGSDPYFLFGDAFLALVNPQGTALLYSTLFGGSQDDVAFGLALDSAGRVYLAGNTFSVNFKTTTGAAQSTFGGSQQVFPELLGDAFYSVLSGFAANPPSITLVANAEGESPVIAPNTWVEIKGVNLAPPNDARIWQASDFVNGQMPTQLDGVSATVNGKSAFVWYISATQVNILTPPDALPGPVDVRLTNRGAATSAFTAQAQALSPSFFVFDARHIVAVHLDGSDVGPATLYPGLTTPAKPGETVVIFANGFGPTNAQIVPGSSVQSGSLSVLPVINIGGVAAKVTFAGLVAPGEFQFNVTIPDSLPSGDQPITASYNNLTTQSGAVITIQN